MPPKGKAEAKAQNQDPVMKAKARAKAKIQDPAKKCLFLNEFSVKIAISEPGSRQPKILERTI